MPPAQSLDPVGQRRSVEGQDRGLGLGVQVLLLLRLRLVGEADHQLAVLDGRKGRRGQPEAALLAGLFLDVAVLALGGVRQLEVDAHRVRFIFRAQAEGVVAEAFAGLDVVLVRVGPVELDLLALVGDGVDAGLVDALAEEVALRVVAAKETVEMVVDLGFQRPGVHVQFGLVGGVVLGEGLLHLRQQVLVQELRHLRVPCMQDAVDAEVQLRLVELEQLLEQGFQFFVFLAHCVVVLLNRWRARRFVRRRPSEW